MPSAQVFLSYAKEDVRRAKRLREMLQAHGVRVWFDEESLRPGERWQRAIRLAIRDSRYFIALLSSRSVSKRGNVQKEIREALDVLASYPDHEIYLIPVRLDDCTPSHERLNDLQWVDLFRDRKRGVDTLVDLIVPKRERNADTAGVPRKPKTDGIYVARTQGDYYRYYFLRFFSDRTVVATSSSLTPAEIEPHMTPYNPYMASGVWRKRGAAIRFSTKSDAGTIDYEGILGPESLMVKKHSRINGYWGIYKYKFRSLLSMNKGS